MSALSLVSAAWLESRLGNVTVLDVRYRTGEPQGYDDFLAGHVPGAAYVDLETALAGPPGERGRHPLPEEARFEGDMRRAGVRMDRPVLVYDDWGGRAAARAWWLLRHHGHPQVHVLDGGWSAWVEGGGDSESGTVTPEPGDFTISAEKGLPVVEADAVLQVGVLVDARAEERYRGEVEPIDPVAGHIPGAVNVPTELNLDADGRFRSAEELRASYAEVGATGDTEVAAYCGSGVTAAHDVLAMEVAGIHAALYPGSWSEWITDPERPVETG
ncbi:MAG TPA: sulfurtransferase [Nocardioides sp.]|nr:sulfurtransferase [Nocardioides sp.]